MRRLALPVLLALAACGQKGNLYLPDDIVETVPVSTGPVASPPTTPLPAAADEDPDSDKPARRN